MCTNQHSSEDVLCIYHNGRLTSSCTWTRFKSPDVPHLLVQNALKLVYLQLSQTIPMHGLPFNEQLEKFEQLKTSSLVKHTIKSYIFQLLWID